MYGAVFVAGVAVDAVVVIVAVSAGGVGGHCFFFVCGG